MILDTLIRETCFILSSLTPVTFISENTKADPDISSSSTTPVYISKTYSKNMSAKSFYIHPTYTPTSNWNFNKQIGITLSNQEYYEELFLKQLFQTINPYTRTLLINPSNTILTILKTIPFIQPYIDILNKKDKKEGISYKNITLEEASRYPYSICISDTVIENIKSDIWIIPKPENNNDWMQPSSNNSFWYLLCTTNYHFCSNETFSSFFQRKQLRHMDLVLIGLLNRIDRRQPLISQLDNLFIPYRYNQAVNGKEIHIGIFDQSIPSLLKHPNQIAQLIYRDKLYLHDMSSRQLKMSYGEFGCALSHLLVYDELQQQENNNAVLVFEDDAYIEDSFEFIQQLRHLPSFSTIDLVYLQNEALWWAPQPDLPLNNYFATNVQKGSNKTHSYILTKKGLTSINQIELSKSKSYTKDSTSSFKFINVPSDDFLNQKITSGSITSVSPFRRVVGTQGSKSDIWNIHKQNEDYRMVTWDKHILPPYGIHVEDMGDWSRLGNQMFQYAVCTLAAMKKNSFITLPLNRISNSQITLMKVFKDIKYSKHLIVPTTEEHPLITIKEEKEFNIIPELISNTNLPSNILVKGYFQNADYFEGYESIVYNLFRFNDEIQYKAETFIREWIGYTPISVHIRLKDIRNDTSEFLYSIWSEDKLGHLIKKVLNMTFNPVLFIHSSDFQECKRIYQSIWKGLIVPIVFVEKSEGESLAIMSLCNIHIISSSTYSWWGAWLAEQRYKQKGKKDGFSVYIPSKWFNPKVERMKGSNVSGLYIKGWTVVEEN
jgi:GR25 family glycosyltransferase involved in LPS biosynthesis